MRLRGLRLQLRRRAVQNRIAVRRLRPDHSLVMHPARELMGRLARVLELGLGVRVLLLFLVRVRKHVHPRAVAVHDDDLMPRHHRRNRRIVAVRHHIQVRDVQHGRARSRIIPVLVVVVLSFFFCPNRRAGDSTSRAAAAKRAWNIAERLDVPGAQAWTAPPSPAPAPPAAPGPGSRPRQSPPPAARWEAPSHETAPPPARPRPRAPPQSTSPSAQSAAPRESRPRSRSQSHPQTAAHA